MYSRSKALNFGNYVPNDKILNKKVPENPKYKHVKPAVDTGKNVRRHIDELKEKQKCFNVKSNEVFKRIKLSHFLNLVIISANELRDQELAGGDHNADENDSKSTNNTLTNVLMGYGEIDVANEKSRQTAAKPIRKKLPPYLLLDVREKHAFMHQHIKTAKHYPSAMLSRSTGYEIEEMKIYKKSGIVILYDDDETIASRAATTLIQRGYNDVYILSGGMKFMFESLTQSLVGSVCGSTHFDSPESFSALVVVRSSSEECFSTDDVTLMEQFVEGWTGRAYTPSYGTRSYSSYSKPAIHSVSLSEKPGTAFSIPGAKRESKHHDSLKLSRSADCVRMGHSNSASMRKNPWK